MRVILTNEINVNDNSIHQAASQAMWFQRSGCISILGTVSGLPDQLAGQFLCISLHFGGFGFALAARGEDAVQAGVALR